MPQIARSFQWYFDGLLCGPGSEGSKGSKGKVLKMDGPSAQGFLGLTGPLAPRVVDCPSGNAYKVSVTGLAVCVIWQNKHYVDQPPPVAFPPFGALRHHLPPAMRWDNKDPQSNPFISRTTISTGYFAPACGGSPAKRARGNAFPTPARAVVWFYTNWRLL